MTKVQFNTWLDPKMHQQVRDAAHHMRMPITTFVADALRIRLLRLWRIKNDGKPFRRKPS